MPFVTASDVEQLHFQLDTQQQQLDACVTACVKATTLDAASAAQWHLMTGRIAAYLGDAPSTLRAASQMDTGQQLQRDLHPWYGVLRSRGCANVPPEPSPPPAPADLFGSLQGIMALFVIAMLLREAR